MAAQEEPAPDRSAPTFGNVLLDLRRSRGIPQYEVARRAGVTPTHLSRIELGRRPPPRRTTVLRLADALGLREGAERAELLAVAGYIPDTALDPEAIGGVEALLENAVVGLRVTADGEARFPPLPVPPEVVVPNLPTVIRGNDAVVQAAFLLLQVAAKRPVPEGNGTVCLSLADAANLFHATPALRGAWHAGLRGLLRLGWRFRHIWQLPMPGSWSPRVIAELSSLLAWPDQYEPAYVYCEPAPPWSPRDLLLVPGVGALVGLANGHDGIEAALLVGDTAGIDALGEFFARCWHRTEPLATAYLSGESGSAGDAARLRFIEASAEAEEQPGERTHVKDGLPNRLIPPPGWWAQAARGGSDCGAPLAESAYRRRLYDCRRRTQRAFEAQVEQWRFREVCSARAIRQFVERGSIASDDFLMDGLPPLPVEDRGDVLLDLLRQLRRNRNYEVALLDDELDHHAGIVWLTKGPRFFSLELFRRLDDGHRQDFVVTVTEEQLVAGFRSYFDQLWQGLPPRCRDKERVGQWFDRQLDRLR